MRGATNYLAGEMSVDGDWVEIEDAEPCPICFRMIKNSGIDKIVSKKGILKLRYPLQ
jgi:dCMP deaminase